MSAAAQVRLSLPDGRLSTLVPGDIVGRMPRAALRVDDPRISEAHVMVSLRGAELKLMALRGRMSVDGRPANSVTLASGLRVILASFLPLTVVSVTLPDHVLALELDDPDGQTHGPLPLAGVMALHLEAPPRLVPSFDPEAPVIVWADEGGVGIRVRDGADRRLGPGDELDIGEHRARVVSLPLSALASESTLEHGFDVPLTVVLHYDTVHVRPGSGVPVVLDGLAARLLSEVAQLSTPTSWQSLAHILWDDEDDEGVLRQRWDQATSRIRRKLRAGRVRADLLRSTGAGLVELYLGPEDRVEDLS